MRVRYTEMCAGTGAVALRLMGSRRHILPYQGSKWRYSKELVTLMGLEGQPIVSYLLNDLGPWGCFWDVWSRKSDRQGVIYHLQRMAQQDPQDVYDRLQGSPTSTDPLRYVAEFLFLQRLAYSGKAVQEVDGTWKSPGFNGSSAYGVAATPRFGAVNPQLPRLVERLEYLSKTTVPPTVIGSKIPLRGLTRHLEAIRLHTQVRDVVYIDPPYEGVTGYGLDVPRSTLLETAKRLVRVGCSVHISERIPLDEHLGRGWTSVQLGARKDGNSPFKSGKVEWLTSYTR